MVARSLRILSAVSRIMHAILMPFSNFQLSRFSCEMYKVKCVILLYQTKHSSICFVPKYFPVQYDISNVSFKKQFRLRCRFWSQNPQKFYFFFQIYVYFIRTQHPLVGQSLHDHTHLDILHPIRIFWKKDQPDKEFSTWQHTTLTRDRLPCPRPDLLSVHVYLQKLRIDTD
jgi:hypothetical protein